VAAPSTDPEKVGLLSDAVIDFVARKIQSDGLDWLDKNFISTVKESKIVDKLLPAAQDDRNTSNWQNSWISLAAFGFRKNFAPKKGLKNVFPKPSTRCFTPLQVLNQVLYYKLENVDVIQEQIDSFREKKLLTKLFIRVFSRRYSSALTGMKEPTKLHMMNFEKVIMQFRRVSNIKTIFKDLHKMIVSLDDGDLEDEQRSEIETQISRYVAVMNATNKLCNWIEAKFSETPNTQDRVLEKLIKMSLVWAPLDFFAHVFGPLEGCDLWDNAPDILPQSALQKFRYDSTVGTVSNPSNSDLRNRIKAKIMSARNVEDIGQLAMDYLGFVLNNTQPNQVEALLDFEYLCYSKDFNGTGDFNYEGFYDEVERGFMNESTPKQFGFIKSYSNFNW
jgi:hypothetical protein